MFSSPDLGIQRLNTRCESLTRRLSTVLTAEGSRSCEFRLLSLVDLCSSMFVECNVLFFSLCFSITIECEEFKFHLMLSVDSLFYVEPLGSLLCVDAVA